MPVVGMSVLNAFVVLVAIFSGHVFISRAQQSIVPVKMIYVFI